MTTYMRLKGIAPPTSEKSGSPEKSKFAANKLVWKTSPRVRRRAITYSSASCRRAVVESSQVFSSGLRREVSGQIVNNFVEFVIGAVCSFVDHVHHNLSPMFLGFMFSQDDLRRVTATTNLLRGCLPLSFR